MCGLVGIVSPHSNGLSKADMDAFTNLLFLDTMRGYDSTGVCGVDYHGNCVIHKQASNGLDFIRTRTFDEFSQEMIMRGKMIFGHNRAATKGVISDQNAHPFVVDNNIILAQNGTWRGDHKHIKDTEVDSEAVAHLVHEHADDVANAVRKINASYALVWYNVEKKTMSLIRNTERPLYLASYNDNAGFIFSSESDILQFSARRGCVRLDDAPKMITPGTLYNLVLGENRGVRLEEEDLKLIIPVTTTPFQQHKGNVYPIVNTNPGRAAVMTPTATAARGVSTTSNDNTTQWTSVMTAPENKAFLYHSMEDAGKGCDLANELKQSDDCFIEVVNYFPGNDSKDCRCWWIIGTFVNQEISEEGPAPVVYWLQYGMTEEEVLYQVYQNFFKVKLNTTIVRHLKLNNESRYLVSMFASERTKLDQNVMVS